MTSQLGVTSSFRFLRNSTPFRLRTACLSLLDNPGVINKLKPLTGPKTTDHQNIYSS